MSVHSISQVMRLACVIFKRNFTLDYIDNVHSCKIEKAEQFCSAFVGVAGFEPAAFPQLRDAKSELPNII